MPNIEPEYDIAILGGGINGCGIAADAAGRGLRVLLCEAADLASGTSSVSSKLIHGGLRYLEQYDFRLVREALKEREVLLTKAPHLVTPLSFIMPHAPHLRSAWLIRAGLWLYDHLSTRETLAASKQIKLSGAPLKPHFTTGFSYMDCRADDARLVIANAQHAHQQGATILNYTQLVAAKRTKTHWQLNLLHHTGETLQTSAKVIFNATGPWVQSVNENLLGVKLKHPVVLSQGSHIVVPALYAGDHAYLLQNPDKRIVFVIPFYGHSLIGTTDTPYTGDPRQAQLSDTEKKYLLESVAGYFQQAPHKILWHYTGVRPLMQGKNSPAALSTVTREYGFEIDYQTTLAPLITVLGGKLTTYRQLAEKAVNILSDFFPQMRPAWTAHSPLPGGDFTDMASLQASCEQEFPWLPTPLLQRYCQQYGTTVFRMLEGATQLADLGKIDEQGLSQREVEYLRAYEWVVKPEDILWRRTKLGLAKSS